MLSTTTFFLWMEQIPTLATAYFVSVALALVAARCVPQLERFFQHGKLVGGGNLKSHWALDALGNISVPKSWFAHFYFLFLALMLFFCCSCWDYAPNDATRLLWVLLTLQAARRSLESVFVTRWSTESRMHISHYAVGILFYVLIPLIVFLGLEAKRQLPSKQLAVVRLQYVLGVPCENFREFLSGPLVFLYLYFSMDQLGNHLHLSSLKKYTAPTADLFLVVACAHYLDEVILYGIIALLSLNSGNTRLSIALGSAWLFVLVNLSISARETQVFYQKKFDDYRIRYCIIPYLY